MSELANSAAQATTAPLTRIARIANQRGLHARAAAKFVKTLEGLEVEVWVTRGEISVSGRSIMGLMMLAACTGCDIELSATGRDREAALAALTALIERKFDEE